MMDRFEWTGPTQVVFGCGVVARLPEWCSELGRRVLVVTGRAGRAEDVVMMLKGAGVMVTPFAVEGEPTVAMMEAGREVARVAGCDWVLGLGGGGAVDAGKALAALVANKGPVLEYLEVIGKGLPLEQKPLPYVAVPTTAGTGAEATRNAVLASPEHGVKVSLRHAWMLPRLALVDPELAVTVPPEVTATTGMDALTQLLEAWVGLRANPMTDALCREGVERAVRSLRRVVADGRDLAARSDMALAALLSGMALANAGLGAVHGFAAPLGGKWGIAHGAVCAALLPAVWEVNLAALRQRGEAAQLERFRQAARWLTGRADARAEEGVEWLRELVRDLRIPGLAALGVTAGDWGDLIPLARRASSMRGNPLELTEEELTRCLALASE
jgi:alcohol dehydrogenase class IV